MKNFVLSILMLSVVISSGIAHAADYRWFNVLGTTRYNCAEATPSGGFVTIYELYYVGI